VLFHGGHLPLRIFEPRYLDMISRCMREQSGFGVVLIRAGSDARLSRSASQPDVFEVGTEAEIVDFNQLKEGMLGIVVRGGRKFRIRETYEQPDHLLMGKAEYLPEERRGELLPEHQPLVDILKQLVQHPMFQQLNLEVDFEDSRSVSWRLSELLPNIEPEIKQSLLQLQWPGERLAELTRLVNKLRG
jgi:Lon protease-like protein